jgi:hypothetical protein
MFGYNISSLSWGDLLISGVINVCGLSSERLAMHVGCFESAGCLEYYVKYVFNHSFFLLATFLV